MAIRQKSVVTPSLGGGPRRLPRHQTRLHKMRKKNPRETCLLRSYIVGNQGRESLFLSAKVAMHRAPSEDSSQHALGIECVAIITSILKLFVNQGYWTFSLILWPAYANFTTDVGVVMTSRATTPSCISTVIACGEFLNAATTTSLQQQ